MNDRELLAGFHRTLSDQLNARLVESPTSAAPAVKGEPTPLVGSPSRPRGCRF